MAVDPEIKAQLQAEAEKALEEPESQPAPKQDDPPAEDNDSAAADPGESGDEPTDDEEDQEQADEQEDPEKDDPDAEDDEDSEDDEGDLDDEEEPKGNRSQRRIKRLIQERNEARNQNAELNRQLLAAKTPAEKKELDQKLQKDGWTPEQIAEGKRYLKAMGLDVDSVAALQGQMKTMEEKRLMDEDRAELRTALSKSKSSFTEKEVMAQVQKWANHSNPKVQARASLDYPAILRLMASKTAPAPKPVVEKKKAAPKIPKGGSDAPSPQKKEQKKPFEWDPSDKRGSLARLQAEAEDALEQEGE